MFIERTDSRPGSARGGPLRRVLFQPWLGIVVLGIATTAWFAHTVGEHRDHSVDMTVESEIDERLQRIEQSARDAISVLADVASLLDIAPDLTPEDFSDYVTPILAREPAIHALSWNPRVRGEDRDAFLAAARGHFPDYRITEPSEGGPVPAAKRPEYTCVLYIEPSEANQGSLGLDIAAEPIRKAAIDRARDRQEFSVTDPFPLVQEPDAPLGFLAVHARFEEGTDLTRLRSRLDRLLGVVVGVFRVDHVIERALGRLGDQSLDIELVDRSKGVNRTLLIHRAGALGGTGLPHPHWSERTIDWGGRSWLLRFHPHPQWLAGLRGGPPHWIWITGLLGTALLALVVSVVSARSRRTITDRVLRENEERLHLTIASISDGWWDWIPTTDRVTVSSRWLTALGYEGGERIESSRFLEAHVHPDDVEPRRTALERHLAGLSREFSVELRLCRTDGQEQWVHERGSVVERGRDGSPRRMVGAIIDITDRKTAEAERAEIAERVRETERLEDLGRLAGVVAHDFNNWLTTIRNNVDLVRESTGSVPEVRDSLIEIESATRQAADLTRQLLDYTEQGQPAIRRESIDLAQIVDELSGLLCRAVPRDVRVVSARREAPVTVEGDAGQLGQVVMNLVTNAADAVHGSGLVRIATRCVDVPESPESPSPESTESRETSETPDDPETPVSLDRPAGRYSVLTVSDDGCGMSEEVRARVFEPFYSTKETGRGLGLSGVQGIVHRHGGTIAVESEEGRGTTIEVWLPYVRPPAETPRRTHSAPTPGTRSRTRSILIVDDEPGVRKSTQRLLERAGHRVEAVETGDEGIARIRTAGNGAGNAIDVAVLDLTMPGLDGIETFERMRELQPSLRGVLVSGYAPGEIGTLPEGLVGFLQKPYRTEELLTLIEHPGARNGPDASPIPVPVLPHDRTRNGTQARTETARTETARNETESR